MKYRLLNRTTKRYVIDADSDDGTPCEFDDLKDAERALERVNDLKGLNPQHANDVIEIVEI